MAKLSNAQRKELRRRAEIARHVGGGLNQLLRGTQYSDLVSVSKAIWCCNRLRKREAEYGLPTTVFVFVETLCWSAQSLRSGAWTYHETTHPHRQSSMVAALNSFAPVEFASNYWIGSQTWTDPERISPVDLWLEENDGLIQNWLRQHALTHIEIFEEILGE